MKSSRRHDLKHDQIADTLGQFWEYVVLHRAKVFAALAAIALVVGVGTWVYTARAMAHSEAASRLAEAEDVIWQVEALRHQDRDQAERLAGRVISDLVDLAEAYPRTPSAALALFKAGRLSLEQGEHEAAARTFRQVVANTADRPFLQRKARLNLAASLEEGGDYTAAMAEYAALAEDATGVALAEAHWHIGRCREALGDVRQALEAYAAAERAAPGSAWAEQAFARTQALQAPRRAERPPVPAPEDEPLFQDIEPPADPAEIPADVWPWIEDAPEPAPEDEPDEEQDEEVDDEQDE